MKLDLERYVPALVTFIANKQSVSATKVYKKEFNISVTEWRILSMLAVEPNINAQRIIECIGLDKAAVSRNVKTLVDKQLVAVGIDPNDLRSHSISLTPAGDELHAKVIHVALAREKKLLANLNPMEIENLIYLLNKLHKNSSQS